MLERLRGTALAHALLVMEQLHYLRVGAQELDMHLLERIKEGERAERAEVGTLREANEAHYIRIIKEGITPGRTTSGESTPGGKIFARRPEPDIALVSPARGRIHRRAKTNGCVDRRVRRGAGVK